MTIEAFRVRNFMAFADSGWMELRPITLLFGRNSAGKSAIIRALLLLKQSLDLPPEAGPLAFESRYGVDLGEFREMVHGRDENAIVWFYFTCAEGAIEDALTRLHAAAPVFTPARKVHVVLGYGAHRELGSGPNFRRVELVNLQLRGDRTGKIDGPLLFEAGLLPPEHAELYGDDWFVAGPLAEGAYAGAWTGLRCRVDRGFAPDLVPPQAIMPVYSQLVELLTLITAQVLQFLKGLGHIGPIRPEPQRRYSFDKEGFEKARDRGWADFVEFIFGRRASIQGDVNFWIDKLQLAKKIEPRPTGSGGPFAEYEITVTESGVQLPLPLSAHGFGISQVLPVIVQSLVVEPPNVLIVEQPELHLHPAAQTHLADLFLNRALRSSGDPPDRRPRFMLETHSEHLMLRFMRRMRNTVEKKLPNYVPPIAPGDVAVYVVERREGEVASRMHQMEVDEDGRLLEPWPGGFFEEGFRERFDQRER